MVSTIDENQNSGTLDPKTGGVANDCSGSIRERSSGYWPIIAPKAYGVPCIEAKIVLGKKRAGFTGGWLEQAD
ncbi:MAG: hypothetical protein ABGW87_08735 [Sphingomonadaceae bacterium]